MSKKKTIPTHKPTAILLKNLNYTFKDESLLDIALTHCSVGPNNNERFEFLGDSLVNLVIAEKLYRQFPKATEGQLTRMRAICVRGETLATIARELQLGEFLKLGVGEIKSGGANRPSILADTLEAMIAAIYLDSDFETIRALILGWYEARLNSMSLDMTQKDPKTQLQEVLQAQKIALPVYTVIAVEGESHEQLFTVTCQVDCLPAPVEGKGPSRRKAEQNAAAKILEQLNHDRE